MDNAMISRFNLQEGFEVDAVIESTQVPRGSEVKLHLVPDLIAVQARVRPKAVAVQSGREQITFAELDHCSNQLARRLRSLGVCPEVPVGICLTRSTVLVVAALAVLKAGGAYVPLDPNNPRERIAHMMEDSGAAVLIQSQCIANRLPSGRWQSIVLDGDPRPLCEASESLAQTAIANNLAYVIYTSGSTGSPKAVDVTHSNLLNLVRWHQRAFQIMPDDRTTQLASLGFDAAVWEIWPSLTAGASLHLPNDDLRNSPERLRDWLVANDITVTFVPTPLAEQLIELPWPKRTALRIMLTGADVLHRYPVAGLPFVLVNNYGPAECTVVSTSAPIPPRPNMTMLPPIGRPIDGVHIRILDENMRNVEPGQTGEIYIGGAGVARGYHGDPKLTLSRFVPDPFSPDPKARLYRSGDQGTWLCDGEIAFHGRRDQLIKIRGLRIEPNEIIAVLNTHASLKESAVVARDYHGEKSLVGYVVPRAGQKISGVSLKQHLSVLLPDYMCPSIFVQICSLPLTPNGKTDLAALPAPDDCNTIRDHSDAAAVTEIEECVSGILARVLGMKSLGRDENFFLVGGHSLLGAQVLTQLQKTFDTQISLKHLFENPTVAQLSTLVERQLASTKVSDNGRAEVGIGEAVR
jgi:amino acid adenylation domain-containing protein